MKKITITGTKGKTTVSNILAQVLRAVEPKVLHVDTSGVYLNGKQRLSKLQSQQIWDVVPTVAPGRFLYLMQDDPESLTPEIHHGNIPGVAVLEASLGCGTNSGLGYYGHDVGVFTNVFEDHIGSRPDLQSRADIGQSKKFILQRINQNGYAVVNADDDIIMSLLHECKDSVTILPFGLTFAEFDLDSHLKGGGAALTIQGTSVVLLQGQNRQELFDFDDIGWMFHGKFTPSQYNLLAITGALLGYGDMELSTAVIDALKASTLDRYSGRLTLLETPDKVTILADYAHEKQSLKSVAELAHSLKASPENKVIGIVRLTWDRDEPLIIDTANYIADSYDQFVVYDKIDGYWRQPSERFRTSQRQFQQEVGKISAILSRALVARRGEDAVVRIIREDEAIEAAHKLAQPGDVVVFIVNDNIIRSLGFIQKSFKAEFV